MPAPTDDTVLNDDRDRLAEAALGHAAFDGWTIRALQAAAVEIGLGEADANRLFPRGMAQAAAHVSAWADRRMLDRLGAMDLDSMRVRDRVVAGVRSRLEVLSPYREGVRRLSGFMALPMNSAAAARATFCTVDAIWYAAGDRATDFNYYTKRGLLTAVYAPTVLYWLSDTSEGLEDTWSFLDRRIDDVMKIPKMTGRLRKPFDSLCRMATVPFRRASRNRWA